MQTNDNLQMTAIRRTFDQLDKDQQEFLLRDLMRQAGVYLISRGVISQDVYKWRFVEFFRSSWLKTTYTLKDDYIDECFKIWKMFERKSIGDAFGSLAEMGDWSLTTCPGTDDTVVHDFVNDELRHDVFQRVIFAEAHVNFIQLGAWYPVDADSWARCWIHVTELFERLLTSRDEVYMILMIFGYLDGEELEKYSKMLNKKYPGYDKLAKMLIGEKLEAQLGVRIMHDIDFM